MMGRGRTNHHVGKKRSEVQSRRLFITMDHHFMEINSAANTQRMTEESVTCIATKEDRHQNIMDHFALKKGVQESWITDKVTKFMDLLDYREITLKSDTESAIIAFRDRVVEVCRAEVMTEDAVKGIQESTDSLATS